MRLHVIGDELAAGTGDSRGLGWVGCVLARSKSSEPPALVTLVPPRETTKDLRVRREGEIMSCLLSGGPWGLFVHIGTNNILTGLSSARSCLSLASITGRATALGIPCFVVGPAPLAGVNRHSIKELLRFYAEVCQRRGLPYVDLATPLTAHD